MQVLYYAWVCHEIVSSVMTLRDFHKLVANQRKAKHLLPKVNYSQGTRKASGR